MNKILIQRGNTKLFHNIKGIQTNRSIKNQQKMSGLKMFIQEYSFVR